MPSKPITNKDLHNHRTSRLPLTNVACKTNAISEISQPHSTIRKPATLIAITELVIHTEDTPSPTPWPGVDLRAKIIPLKAIVFLSRLVPQQRREETTSPRVHQHDIQVHDSVHVRLQGEYISRHCKPFDVSVSALLPVALLRSALNLSRAYESKEFHSRSRRNPANKAQR